VRISVLGTGQVGRILAGGLAAAGHEMVTGTRDPDATLVRTEPDNQGTPPYAQWQDQHPAVRLLSFVDAGAHAVPNTRVVKTLNTMAGPLMVDPGSAPGAHVVFVAGDDAAAKETVTGLLGDVGWAGDRIVGLGALRAARGMEMYVVLWWDLTRALGTYALNVAVERA
jgi:predicted dinucleotide-binding enzyme